MRPEKKAMTDEIRQSLGDGVYVILTDYQGLDVAKTTQLRNRLQGVQARYHVVKNRLLRHVVNERSEQGWEAGLKGPTAMVTGTGDIVEVAKLLRTFIRENERPVIKIGSFDGVLLSAADIDQLAGLPSRTELLGKFVGTVAAPLSQFVGVLNQKLSSLLYVLKAVEEKKQQQA